MKHPAVHELVDYFCGRLTLQRELELDAHFAGCQACTEQARQVRGLVTVLERSSVTSLRQAFVSRPGATPIEATESPGAPAAPMAGSPASEGVPWLGVLLAVTFVAARGSARLLRAEGEQITLTEWAAGDLSCLIQEGRGESTLSLSTTERRWAGRLVRFSVRSVADDAEWHGGWLVLGATRARPDRFTGSVRLSPDRPMPDRCRAGFELCELQSSRPPDVAALRRSLVSALHDDDLDAWRIWADEESAAGRLSAADRRTLFDGR